MKYLFVLFWILVSFPGNSISQTFYPRLKNYTSGLDKEFNQIDPGRKQKLEQIANYVVQAGQKHDKVRLCFVCTHNSRRSQFAQVWMKTAADHYGIPYLETYSGGTEATAANIRTIDALDRAGFRVSFPTAVADNPVYFVSEGKSIPESRLFSKKFDDKSIPSLNFAAVMVCSEADASCPLVPGAEDRFSLPYEDPKVFDGSEQEEAEYDKTSREIAREMFYLASKVKLLEKRQLLFEKP